MRIKGFLVLALIVCMLGVLCACGGEQAASPSETTTVAPSAEQTTPATAEQTAPAATEDGKVTYTVKVVDGNGAPMVGVAVQICKDSCMPGVTNAEGVATFRVVEAEGYKVSFLTVPEGYTAQAEEFYFEAGAMEMVLTLTAA